MILFSRSRIAFFDDCFKEGFDKAGTWPDDAVEITQEQYLIHSRTPPEGKMLGADKTGLPAWVDKPPLSTVEQLTMAEAKRSNLISVANAYMSDRQWPGKAAIGRLKGGELAQYGLWLDYLDALYAVDASAAPDIEWPTQPE